MYESESIIIRTVYFIFIKTRAVDQTGESEGVRSRLYRGCSSTSKFSFLRFPTVWAVSASVMDVDWRPVPSPCFTLVRPYLNLSLPLPFKRRIKSHLPFANIIRRFNVHGSVHRKYIPDATLHSFFISGNCSTCFGWYFHPSSGSHTTVSTVSGICHTVTAICRYLGTVGTGLSVLWVVYATHSTLKPVPTPQR
jgi:hypothetical protein